ncbi:hypothetical protein BX616_000578, partial [Lobosporangium transversale]
EKPVLVDFSNGVNRSPIFEENPPNNNNDNSNREEDSTKQNSSSATGTNAGQTQLTLVVTFDRQGKRVYTGSNRGLISIIDTETRNLLHEIRATTSAIKNIQFSRKGKEFVVNANDRVIRLFTVNEQGPPEQVHKFQDLVNRIQWNQCCFSSDSDYVIGGSAHQTQHNIYIWDKIGGFLVKILEGPKEPLEDVAVIPIVASVSSYGIIHIWATNYQENWSAFAPDFKELEENIDYEEREDEFDIVPEEEASKRKHDDEDILIDVTTIEKVNPFNDSDSDNGEEETFYLPLLPSDQQDAELLNQKHHRRHRRHQHRRHHHHHRNNNQSHHTNENDNNGHRYLRHDQNNSHSHSHSQSHTSSKQQIVPSLSQGHNGNSIIKDEAMEHYTATEDPKRDLKDRSRDRERDRDRDRDRERDHEQDQDRGQEREYDRTKDKDIDLDHEEKHKRRQQQRSEESDNEDEQGLDVRSTNGDDHDYNRDRDRDLHISNNNNSNNHTNSSASRRKLEEHQQHSPSRNVKRQR